MRTALRSSLLCWLGLWWSVAGIQAGAQVFNSRDVVAWVGGEELVAATEFGYLESVLLRAFPAQQLTFRNLAWEGDTAFEQARELNYPSLERQLDDVGASVVVVQFGQMEALGGAARLSEFVQSYERLLDRLTASQKRVVIILAPTPPKPGSATAMRFSAWKLYTDAIREMAVRRGVLSVTGEEEVAFAKEDYRDELHLNERGHQVWAQKVARALNAVPPSLKLTTEEERRLLEAVREKNRLWFSYARPQNWAFLNGDRTSQPSSRDHLDPSKRWFPDEMKAWLPLIAAEETKIWNLARGTSGR